MNKILNFSVPPFYFLAGLILHHSTYADDVGFLSVQQPITLLSINDGETATWLNSGYAAVDDSITVINLFQDTPPISKTIQGTAFSTIVGSPHAAIIDRFGIVTNHTIRIGFNVDALPEITGPNQIVAIDLDSEDLRVTSRVELESTPSLALAHPDGKRIIVGLDDQWQVYTIDSDGQLVELARSSVRGRITSFDISQDGNTIIAAVLMIENESVTRGIFRFALGENNTVSLIGEFTSQQFIVDGPFSPRISPDGSKALILNSGGRSNGSLDDVLLLDLMNNSIQEAIPQVADGLESLAFHPSGEFAVVAGLNMFGPTVTSHLSVIDLSGATSKVLYQLPIEGIPEGIEFTPDGSKLFVGTTFANQIVVYDVVETNLERSPYVLTTGYGPAALALKSH